MMRWGLREGRNGCFISLRCDVIAGVKRPKNIIIKTHSLVGGSICLALVNITLQFIPNLLIFKRTVKDSRLGLDNDDSWELQGLA